MRSGLEKHYSKRHQLRRQEYFSSARNELFGDLNGVRTRERFQDHAVREHQSWKDSLRNVDEMTAMGKAVLESLKSQRGILKKARRKAIDLANVLGVSSSVIRMIEKRDYGDRIIVFVGMFLALLVLAFLYYVVSR